MWLLTLPRESRASKGLDPTREVEVTEALAPAAAAAVAEGGEEGPLSSGVAACTVVVTRGGACMV